MVDKNTHYLTGVRGQIVDKQPTQLKKQPPIDDPEKQPSLDLARCLCKTLCV